MTRAPLPTINADGSYSFIAGMQICADGANGETSLPAYAPVGMKALDYLANAGGPGNWYGIVTDEKGRPVLQKKGDPCPGAYISPTAYMRPGMKRTDPRAYLDAAAVPYIVIPSHWRKAAKGVVMGCRATIEDTKTGKVLECVMGELGPRAKTGEASIFAAQYFGVPASPKNGGTDARRFEYTFYPGAKSVVDVPLIPA